MFFVHPAVSKSSAGAMEIMKVHASRNLVHTLKQASETGWLVVGAALRDSVEPKQLDNTRPTVLVLGSEGHGLRTNVVRACNSMVRIPRGVARCSARDNDASKLVDSLNVSVAGGILMHALLSSRNH